jgi:hypothetical protein
VRGACLLLTASVVLAGCGGGRGAASPEEARACLEQGDLRVLGGQREPGDADAPDTELIVAGRQSSAFLAFYDDEARAVRYEPDLQARALEPGAVERHGSVTIFWVRGRRTREGEQIKSCVVPT